MTNGHCNAEHTNRSFSFMPNVASIIALCRASNFWDSPTAELDMFSRWIKLSDDLLAANRKPLKKAASHRRSKLAIVLSAKPA